MSTWTSDLLIGLAEYAAANGGGTWNPAGIYTSGQTGIMIAASPPEPDKVVILTPYGPLGQWDDGDVLQGLQIRYRGARNDPTSTYDLRDTWRDLLDGIGGDGLVEIGGVLVSQIFAKPGTSLGFDGNVRLEWSDNFHIQAARPTALRQ
jgi:hypothetical protein